MSVERHDRDSTGMRYIYAVLSRRAGGVSVGVNLNTNNACNWACVYCQVPELRRGGPEPVDLDRLEGEFTRLLEQAVGGEGVFAGASGIVDVAFSGNGEPTSAPEFGAALERVAAGLSRAGMRVPIRLITNGSLIRRPAVKQALGRLGELGGEVWFKVDRAGRVATRRVNGVACETGRVVEDLRRCAAMVPTWVQTCWFGEGRAAPGASEMDNYLALLSQVSDVVAGVHLYGLARPSCQPGAGLLRRLSGGELEVVAARIRALGLPLTVNP